MALIELDLTAQPEPSPRRSIPPAYRYRLPGLALAAVLLLALGGAAPAGPTVWRYLGAVPAVESGGAQSRLAGDRVYTMTVLGAERSATAWQVGDPPRKLWSVTYPARRTTPDDVGFGGADAHPAGDQVLFTDGPATTAVDARSGHVLWRSPVTVGALPGNRNGLSITQVFRPGTVYDQASGDPGLLYFSSTGEPHTEPPVRTEVHGVDLRTGADRWTVALPGSVNVLPAPGNDPAVLVVASDRLDRIDGNTGAITRSVALPKIGKVGPTGGELAGGMLVVRYGAYGAAGQEVGYAPDTLEKRWQRAVPEVLLDPPGCAGVLCAGPRTNLEVLDPATGRTAWHAPATVDLTVQSGYVVEVDIDSGNPVRLVDPATGATRVDLAGWFGGITDDVELPLVVRRALDAGRSAFGVVSGGRVQLLGASAGPVSDCTAGARYVMCRGNEGLQFWRYRAQ
ncbi:PQQ-binding-like beta-propeller repeat protein [Actinoplanes sp. CA-030573]|uniref:outer membrane protein assembly factor BamB family protein n=1 Tax=Actinoplanes sp. CA-030573 TaxID=3239898 RepID=UPI003D91615B